MSLPNLRRAASKLKGTGPRVVLACVVLLLLLMAASLAVRSGLLGFAGEPDSKQFGVFLAFIGASLGAAATVFVALLTQAHNVREQQRLRLDSVIKSLESIPADASKARLAGVLSTMALLGHHRIAVRILKPAWDEGKVDDGTATWVIGQILVGARPGTGKGDEPLDENAVDEAATLLYLRATRLTGDEPRLYHFPGHFTKQWTTERDLPEGVKDRLLTTIGRMLVARDESWWCPGGEPPEWPINVLLDCVRNERTHPVVRSSAAVLVAALRDRYPETFRRCFPPALLESVSALAADADVDGEYRDIADEIRNRWGSKIAVQDDVVVAGS